MILDIVIVSFLLFAAFIGWRKGAITMIASLVILAGAVILSTLFGTVVGKMIGFGPTMLHPVIGFFVLFAILMIIGGFVKKFIKPKRGFLAGVDKIFGLVFGVFRAFLLMGLLFGFLRIFQYPSTSIANRSVGYPLILKTTASFVSQLKPLASQLSNDFYEDISPRDSLSK